MVYLKAIDMVKLAPNIFATKGVNTLKLTVFAMGAIVGSFLNVCICRIPRGESIVFPPSHCTHCGQGLSARDLIPIISYVALRGKCRGCGKGISAQYPVVESLMGILFYLAFARYGWSFEFFASTLLMSSLVISTFIDIEHGIIPDTVTLPTMALGVMIFALFRPTSIGDHILGLLLGGGTIFLIVVLSRGGMGGGDIKLFAMAGVFLGFKGTILALFLSFVLGSIVGIALIALKVKGMKDTIPFGPFIAWGSVLSLFCADTVYAWYFGSFF